jgi:hypothetical protein
MTIPTDLAPEIVSTLRTIANGQGGTMSELREAVTHLHAIIAGKHCEAIERLFSAPMKVSVLVRDPRHPDGSRDVWVSSDEPDDAIAAIRQVTTTGVLVVDKKETADV